MKNKNQKENDKKNSQTNNENDQAIEKKNNPAKDQDIKTTDEKKDLKNTKPVPAKPKPATKPKKKRKLKIFKKKNKAIDTIASIYKQTEELFKNEVEMEKEAKEEETILAHIVNKRKVRRRRTLIIIAFILLLIIAGASAFGFIFFNKKKQFAEDKIKVEILGPDKAQTGDEITYLINYENNGQINLNNIKMHVRLPNGFSIIEKMPETENSSWSFNKLKINDSGQIKIKGKIIDNPDTEQKLVTTFTYTPENFNSEFSKTTSFSTNLQPIDLYTEISHPQTAIPGQKFNIRFSYENKTDNSYDKLIIKMVTPAEFTILQTQPETAKQEWILENIEPRSEKQEILIEGKFNDEINLEEIEKEQKFAFQILYPGEYDEKFVQSESEFSVSLSDQKVITYLIINGKTENSNTAYGENLSLTAVFKNSGDEDYEDITAKVTIEENPLQVLDWKDSQLSHGDRSKIENGQEIKWNIDSLDAGSEKVIDFTIPIKKLTALQDFSIESLGAQKIKIFSQLKISEDDSAIDSAVIEIGLNTDLSLGIKALYYDSDENQIGSGPLPPQANEKTTYKIFWDISNSLHEITNIKIKTTLADKVDWKGNEDLSTGQITYNSDSNQIIWEINKLPKSVNEAHVNFEISLLPADEDIGDLMKLTQTTTIEAKDAHTGDSIILSLNPISSNLEHDEHGKEQGVVEGESSEE